VDWTFRIEHVVQSLEVTLIERLKGALYENFVRLGVIRSRLLTAHGQGAEQHTDNDFQQYAWISSPPT
jgi:hypothetical protein